ncbi:putative N-acetyltransferase domain-containing protein [Pararobbsia alpina]|uniref:GNAT family N-acetyltransferase n=1 Tax=Pararobbsia alpina TaxID=621374 RepID=UPI0039A432EB
MKDINQENEFEVGAASVGSESAWSEQVEMEAWLDLFAAAPEEFATRAGLKFDFSGEYALFAVRSSPYTLFNRALGMGVSSTVNESSVDHAIAWLDQFGGSVWSVPVPRGMSEHDLNRWLPAKGLAKSEASIARFHFESAQPDVLECPYEVRVVGADKRADFGETLRNAFGMDEGFDTWFGSLPGRPRWTTYVAYDGEAPAATGALFVRGDLAWMGCGATLPEYRGKGAQSALLARRVADAMNLGATRITIETGFDAKQSPNQSHRNVLRAGFDLSYIRHEYQSTSGAIDAQ